MTIAIKRRAGQPVIALALIIVLWVGLRSVLWQSPFTAIIPVDMPEYLPSFAGVGDQTITLKSPDTKRRAMVLLPRKSGIHRIDALDARSEEFAFAPVRKQQFLQQEGLWKRTPLIKRSSNAASHQVLWMAALARLPAPERYAQIIRRGPNPSGTKGERQQEARQKKQARWSFDSWAFYRSGGGTARGNIGPMPAAYGSSQAGGILRYRLASRDQSVSKAYLRITKALSGDEGGDIAAGLSLQPINQLPISVQGEMRVSRIGDEFELRPAALVVTEFPPIKLPLGLQGEIYAQGGYVGGDFATPFADGQAKIEREFVSFDLGRVRAGAGAWGGAQKGASRLDVGPSASLVLPIAKGTARLSVDYRHRIAGNASPPSGIAITLSTGF